MATRPAVPCRNQWAKLGSGFTGSARACHHLLLKVGLAVVRGRLGPQCFARFGHEAHASQPISRTGIPNLVCHAHLLAGLLQDLREPHVFAAHVLAHRAFGWRQGCQRAQATVRRRRRRLPLGLPHPFGPDGAEQLRAVAQLGRQQHVHDQIAAARVELAHALHQPDVGSPPPAHGFKPSQAGRTAGAGC